ncbi:MAG: SDR family NAD(P)-dependent oxidoreductase [Candidatus Wenzhouxiangella sp. M2_3B_020]
MSAVRRVALVTGANRGIGRAICERLSRNDGIRLLAAARRREDAEETASELGNAVRGVALDLADAAGAANRAVEIDAEWGPIDILVNNAGIMPSGGVLAHGIDDFRRCLAVNTVAPFALIRTLAPGMQRRRWGRIVNVSSGWGSFAERLGGPVAYSASKAALNAITVTAAAEVDACVKVNAVCPGWVRTRMGGPDATRSPEEAADTPVWLATLPDDGPTGGFFRRRERIDW